MVGVWEPAAGQMRKTERQDRILGELRWRPHIRAAELASQYGVSTETIRRDLQELSEAGHLERAYGGASARFGTGRPSLDQRKAERIEERDRIARLAVDLISEGETLMVDAGSSTIAFAMALAASGKDVRLITNSLQVALVAGQSTDLDIRLCPGSFMSREAAVIGPDAIEYLLRLNATTCVLGASALNEDGISEAVAGFAQIKRAMIAQSGRALFLMDHSKFGRSHVDRVAGPAVGRILCIDRHPDAATERAWIGGGGQVLLATEEAASDQKVGKGDRGA